MRHRSDLPNRSRRRFAQMLGLAAAGIALPGREMLATLLRESRRELVQHSTFVMGQIANITIYHPDVDHARSVVTMAFDEFRRIDRTMSVFDPTSEIARINAAAGRATVCASEETIGLVNRALSVGKHTSGALDVTVNPLLQLWGFREERSTRPTDAEIHQALDLVGPGLVRIEGDAIGLDREGASIDLGGVAVGYALDRAAEILRREHIDSALIELSGDFYAIGNPIDDARGWEIGIVDPRHEDGIYKRVHIRDQALSTSGNYESVVVYDAVRYGHIVDPSNGFPSHRLQSATVIAPTGFEADAYSTALFVSADQAELPHGARAIVQ